MIPHKHGDVVWHPAPFPDGGRPCVVLNDDDHPFYGEEYVMGGVTTTERERAVALTVETWNEKRAPEPSWTSTWYALTVKHATIIDRPGRLTTDTTDRIAAALGSLVGLDTF